MNTSELEDLQESIVDLYITIKLRPQDEVTLTKHNNFALI